MDDKEICFCEFGDILDVRYVIKNIDKVKKKNLNQKNQDWTKLSECFCDVCYYEEMV